MKKRTRYVTAILAALVVIGLLFLPLPQQVGLDTRIVTVASIQRPSKVVFDYVTTPAHWPAWHPSSLAVSGAVDHSLDLGEQVVEEFRVAGRRGSVVWTVTVREPPGKWKIDGKIEGRSAGTVTYLLTSTASGTRFERTFTYRAPSLWFAILNWLVLRARIQAESDTAVLQLKGLLEVTSQQ
ncbi:SRPBCC family protein [Paraburkholderia madseniana]|uniref:SRPBCC family protein n=1 Tax=Paraburkholderia madseniana TaxID=2599607 RepID=UPI00155911ED|nr:SRPBCC family protein [Paraburkholderia madseniana]NPT69431.1 SRPBCC family protein [Paraburkholderia madseniana]